MKLKFTHVLIFAVLLIIVVILCIDFDTNKITKVIDGNTVELKNGATVKLIGVSSTTQGKEELKKYINTKVSLKADKSNKFNPDKDLIKGKTVYAYVTSKRNKRCLNSALLQKGYSELVEETYLTDSLEAYRSYANKGEAEREVTPTPTPVVPIEYVKEDIKLPEYKMPQERRHSTWYSDGNLNVDMLAEACDFDCPYTRSFAVQLASRASGVFNIKQVCEIFDYCYNKWSYVNDPKGKHDYVAYASESIFNSLSGDCDDFAVLMASCVIAIGGEASVVVAYRANEAHAYAEVCISNFDTQDVLDIIKARFPQYTIDEIHIKNHDGKQWLNLDWQASYPGGPYWEGTRSIYTYSTSTGEWHWSGKEN
ncbi:MAG: transglutaminase domain-containing protein [Bacteroidales bacterium]|nr:transglutaminase domain-containing protein [Bacteroidales bacterium]